MWKCRGQYSDAVLSELENQNDREIEGISAKVKMLKDVLSLPLNRTLCPLNASLTTDDHLHWRRDPLVLLPGRYHE